MTHPCDNLCQYAHDIGMPEHSCGNGCMYDKHDRCGDFPRTLRSHGHGDFFTLCDRHHLEKIMDEDKTLDLMQRSAIELLQARHRETLLRAELLRVLQVLGEVHNWALQGTMGYSASDMMANIGHIRRITAPRPLPAELNRNGADHQIKEGADFWKWDDALNALTRQMLRSFQISPKLLGGEATEATETRRFTSKVFQESNISKSKELQLGHTLHSYRFPIESHRLQTVELPVRLPDSDSAHHNISMSFSSPLSITGPARVVVRSISGVVLTTINLPEGETIATGVCRYPGKITGTFITELILR